MPTPARIKQNKRTVANVIALSTGGGVTPPPDVVIPRLAGRIYGPGHNGTGAAPLTGDGTLKSTSFTQVNDTGAPITDIDFAFQGWTLSLTGPVNNGAAFTIDAAQIEYPVGTVVGTVGATVVPDGGVVASSKITLSTPIPTGATFKVTPSSTVPNGGKYIPNLGFAGIRSYALKSTLKKVALAVIGCDSIATNNNGSFYTAALGRCSVYQNSIIGTKAATFGANAAAKFLPMLAVASFLGLTDVAANVQTNDMTTDTLATIQTNLTAMRDAARTAGLKYNQCTCMPVTKLITAPTVSSLTSSGTVLTAVVSDASKYTVGNLYLVSGATPTDYNVYARCTAVNTGTNTVTFLFAGSTNASATGASIKIVPWAATAEKTWLVPSTVDYGPSSSSKRGQLNAWTRSGVFDSFIEWSDACELNRDESLWKVGGDDALLPTPQVVTISSLIVATTRFNCDFNRGNGATALGFAIALTGANAGIAKFLSGNTGGDVTLAAAMPNAFAVADQVYIATGASFMSTDHLHPVVSANPNIGGQSHLDQVSIAWLTAKLAA